MPERPTKVVGDARELVSPRNRREFLRLMAAGGTLVMLPSLFAACGDDDDDGNDITGTDGGQPGSGSVVTLDFGRADDAGVLNYAFALEQLEAAFYTAVAASFASGFSADERAILTDIRDHEVIHREFFRAAIPAAARIGTLNVSSAFSGIDLADRTTVLTTARTFEDLGVAAYNGAGQYLKVAANLALAGKIVSVEARHAAVIRDLLTPNATDANAFAPRAFDQALAPADVLAAAQPYVVQRPQLANAATFVPSGAPNN